MQHQAISLSWPPPCVLATIWATNFKFGFIPVATSVQFLCNLAASAFSLPQKWPLDSHPYTDTISDQAFVNKSLLKWRERCISLVLCQVFAWSCTILILFICCSFFLRLTTLSFDYLSSFLKFLKAHCTLCQDMSPCWYKNTILCCQTVLSLGLFMDSFFFR